MRKETRTPVEVVQALDDERPGYQLVAVDGIMCSGKSELASSLHGYVGGTVVSLDDFVNKGQGSFVTELRIAEVRNMLSRAVPPIVIEGVCMLAVLKLLETKPDAFVYVQRVNSFGVWVEEQFGNPSEEADVIIAKQRVHAASIAAAMGAPPPPTEGLWEEVVRYHCEHRPLERAQIVYLKKENEPDPLSDLEIGDW